MSEEVWRKTGGVIPAFTLNLLDGGRWESREVVEGKFTLLTIYRGKWCHQCKKHLRELDALINAFGERGVTVVAASADTRERASAFAAELEICNLKIAYEMPLDKARQLGVFISTQAKDEEMPQFCEPAHFLIRPDHRIFAAWISSCAFARTTAQGILDYVDFIGDNSSKTPRGSA